ncbi:MAG: GvpL/GvpF family gas vesicle protein [Pseudomonadota bacterium]
MPDRLTLLAVMTSAAASAALSTLRPNKQTPPLIAVSEAGLTALLQQAPHAPLRRVWTHRGGRAQVAKTLAERQALFEVLAGLGTVIPALPDQTITQAEAGLFLSAHHGGLRDLLEALDGLQQFQVTIAWAEEGVLTRFADSAELAPVLARRGGVSGGALTAALSALKDRLRAAFAAELDPVCVESLALPTTEALVMNRVLLVPAADGADLDTALERIDAFWPEGLSIRLIGPSPAVSCAALELERISQGDVRRAEETLGLTIGAEPHAIAAALKARLIASDRAPGAAIAAAALFRRLARHMRPEAEDSAVWKTPLYRLRQDGLATGILPEAFPLTARRTAA